MDESVGKMSALPSSCSLLKLALLIFYLICSFLAGIFLSQLFKLLVGSIHAVQCYNVLKENEAGWCKGEPLPIVEFPVFPQDNLALCCMTILYMDQVRAPVSLGILNVDKYKFLMEEDK